MDDRARLKRLAAELVDGRSAQPLGGAPWEMLAGELEHLHVLGRTLAEFLTLSARTADAADTFCRGPASRRSGRAMSRRSGRPRKDPRHRKAGSGYERWSCARGLRVSY